MYECSFLFFGEIPYVRNVRLHGILGNCLVYWERVVVTEDIYFQKIREMVVQELLYHMYLQ